MRTQLICSTHQRVHIMPTKSLQCWLLSLVLTVGSAYCFGQTSGGQAASGQGGALSRLSGTGRTFAAAPQFTLRSSPQIARHRVPRVISQGVRHRVPTDYTTIQAAIDASSDGDTVLVSESTYNENIRYRGKAIVVGSLYLIDGDTTHIAKTIIDGSGSTIPDSGSVVYFISGEDTTSVLCGFTIQGGSGTRYYFVWFQGNFWAKAGGGIFCNNAGAKISHNIIKRNRIVAPVPVGGGVEAFGTIFSWYPYIIIEGNWITDNSVHGSSTTPGLWAGSGGVDLTGVQARVVSNTIERDTVIGIPGAYGGGMTLIGCLYGRWPNSEITGNIFRSNYVAAQWEAADGAGLELAFTGDVMINGNTFEGNIGSCSNGGYESEGGGVRITDQDVVGCGRKVLLHSEFLGNTVSCDGLNCGAGLLFYRTLCTVSCCVFRNNEVLGTGGGPDGLIGGGAGIKGASSSYRIENCIVEDNFSRLDGGGLLFSGENEPGMEGTLVNCTVVGNRAGGRGGGIAVTRVPSFVCFNNIFWGDSAAAGGVEIKVADTMRGMAYCDVKGGYAGTGNINIDPKFADSTFRLSDSSRCIGAGVDSLQIGSVWYREPSTCFYGSPRPNPAGSKPDIGACENARADPLTGVLETRLDLPTLFTLEQNYPNPFNPATTIKYQLPVASNVKLVVYDILGREVSLLVNERRDAGVHEVKFDGSGLSSGLYFYRLQAGDFISTKRMLVLK